jgi:hypothetical protein
MVRQSLVAVLATGVVFGGASEVAAQGSSCAERAAIVESLNNKYGEIRQSVGLNQSNGVVEVFASPETGTWTILLTMPNGMSCLMAAGKSWENVANASLRPGKDA